MKIPVRAKTQGAWSLRVAKWMALAIGFLNLTSSWAVTVIRWSLRHTRIHLKIGDGGWTAHRLSDQITVEDVIGGVS